MCYISSKFDLGEHMIYEQQILVNLIQQFFKTKDLFWDKYINKKNKWVLATDKDFLLSNHDKKILYIRTKDGSLILTAIIDCILFMTKKKSFGIVTKEKFNNGKSLVHELLNKLYNADFSEDWQKFVVENTSIEDAPFIISQYNEEISILKNEKEEEKELLQNALDFAELILVNTNDESVINKIKEEMKEAKELYQSDIEAIDSMINRLSKIIEMILRRHTSIEESNILKKIDTKNIDDSASTITED